jgi:hypothetical protein
LATRALETRSEHSAAMTRDPVNPERGIYL